MNADDFFRRLEVIAPGAVEAAHKKHVAKTRKKSLAEQVVEDVADVAAESEALSVADARYGMSVEREEKAERLPRFVPVVGLRLCVGCGRMRKLNRFEGPSRRCRQCEER